jgi:hypothetical protein
MRPFRSQGGMDAGLVGTWILAHMHGQMGTRTDGHQAQTYGHPDGGATYNHGLMDS